MLHPYARQKSLVTFYTKSTFVLLVQNIHFLLQKTQSFTASKKYSIFRKKILIFFQYPVRNELKRHISMLHPYARQKSSQCHGGV
jgi:hypothetical protein